jgi:hypothetical protein
MSEKPSILTFNRGPEIGQSPDIPTVQDKITMFVEDDLRPTIRAFFKTPPLPHWKPPENVDDEIKGFYDTVKIPVVRNKPNLLLHNLRNSSNPHAEALFMGKPNR